jgi:hypothetical protein
MQLSVKKCCIADFNGLLFTLSGHTQASSRKPLLAEGPSLLLRLTVCPLGIGLLAA